MIPKLFDERECRGVVTEPLLDKLCEERVEC